MSYNAELQMLRELGWWYFLNHACYFCHAPLLTHHKLVEFGHRRHTGIWHKLTLHHIDEDRTNNQSDNLAWSHSDCHRRFHKELAERRFANGKTEEGRQDEEKEEGVGDERH